MSAARSQAENYHIVSHPSPKRVDDRRYVALCGVYSCARAERQLFRATYSGSDEGKLEWPPATGEDETGRLRHCLEVRIDIVEPPP